MDNLIIPDAIPILPYAFAKEHGLLAIINADIVDMFYTSGCTPQAIVEVQRVANRAIRLESSPQLAFDQLLQSVYHRSTAKSIKVIESMEETIDLSSLAASLPEKEDLLGQDNEAPVIRMINALLMEALQQKASDIHIETFEKQIIVRFRVDGVLHEIIRLKRSLASLLISRIKIMAKLDIAEKRLPQDGHIMLKSANYEFDIRVSTIPGANAERIVLRLLDKGTDKLNPGSLGMNTRDLAVMQDIIQSPHGIILVTGPTGSGKTTTLYSALSQLNSGEHSILTIEDPIELNLDGIGQTEVNLKIDMTFARGLRAILRQDPDIIMVGEIRDLETAEIAVQASLTGHLVFSTLHTNSAIGAITRLHDMNVEPYLLASSLIGLIAQRLVRRLCDHCKTPVIAQAHECDAIGLPPGSGVQIYHAVGCDQCKQIGYKGRIGIYEVIRIDKEMRRLIHERTSEHGLEAYARSYNPNMMDDARQKILQGLTSIEEVKRVIE
jgi:general secretion pathway protein E